MARDEQEVALIREALEVTVNWIERGNRELAAEQLRFLADFVERKPETVGFVWEPFTEIS